MQSSQCVFIYIDVSWTLVAVAITAKNWNWQKYKWHALLWYLLEWKRCSDKIEKDVVLRYANVLSPLEYCLFRWFLLIILVHCSYIFLLVDSPPKSVLTVYTIAVHGIVESCASLKWCPWDYGWFGRRRP